MNLNARKKRPVEAVVETDKEPKVRVRYFSGAVHVRPAEVVRSPSFRKQVAQVRALQKQLQQAGD